MTDEQNQVSIENRVYEELVSERSLFEPERRGRSGLRVERPEFFCDNCGFYPLQPVHGHFMCPSCHMPTKCCEGMPLELGE